MDVRDGTHNSPKYINNGYPLITSKDFKEGRFDLSKTKYISEKDYQDIIKRSKVEVGDILYSMIGGNIGSMIRINQDNYFDMAIKNVALFKPYQNENINTKYIAYLLESKVREYQTIAIGGAQPFVGLDVFRNSLVPFPPLSEQHRIVAEIEKWFALIDAIESGKTDMQAAIKQAKSKILNLAIHGKLVPQDPSDEPASELLKRINPKAEITCDNGQYGKMPNGWIISSYKNIVKNISSKPFQILQSEIKDKGLYPVISQSCNYIEGFTDSAEKLFQSQESIIFGDHTRNVKYLNFPFVVGADGVKILQTEACCKYIYYFTIFAANNFIQYKGYSRHYGQLSSISVAIPPLAEQHRIVAKIEELFSSLDNIQKALEV